jgi:glycosyltransferase involved in cell wall biosynthesis
MSSDREFEPIRVLQSFPHRIGAGRICTTAWHQAAGVAASGGEVLVMPNAVARPLPESVRVRPTLARGRWRVPQRILGHLRSLRLHDRLVARSLPKLAAEVDLVHAWPLGALETLRRARDLGIPTVLERPNAHTRFAYSVVREEAERLDVELPPDHEHAWNDVILEREEAEYELAGKLLCPSDFVAQSFLDQGFDPRQLARHVYGYDHRLFHPGDRNGAGDGLILLFVGVCAVRKGVHFALDAWLRSSASRTGTFLIAGEFLPAYADRLADMLDHPSVHVLGHRSDVAELMRAADALVLPSIEEGFPLACVEAIGSGCVPLVSEACSQACEPGHNGMVHPVADVETLAEQLTRLDRDRELLEQLRDGCIGTRSQFTWARAGDRLLEVYREAAARKTHVEPLVR